MLDPVATRARRKSCLKHSYKFLLTYSNKERRERLTTLLLLFCSIHTGKVETPELNYTPYGELMTNHQYLSFAKGRGRIEAFIAVIRKIYFHNFYCHK